MKQYVNNDKILIELKLPVLYRNGFLVKYNRYDGSFSYLDLVWSQQMEVENYKLQIKTKKQKTI